MAQISLRIPQEVKDQIEVIAKTHHRSVNSELLVMIEREIKRFKDENPEIQLDIFTK